MNWKKVRVKDLFIPWICLVVATAYMSFFNQNTANIIGDFRVFPFHPFVLVVMVYPIALFGDNYVDRIEKKYVPKQVKR